MKKRLVLFLIMTALSLGAAPFAGALDIDGNFLLGNLGFTPSRASTDTTFSGADYFWGGSLSLRADLSSDVRIKAALTRDLITGNSISVMLQYTTSWFRVGMGPYIGLFNSSSTVLKSGISNLIGIEIPGAVFTSVRTDISLGGQASTTGDYSAQSNQLLFGFYAGNFAICTFGLLYEQFSSMPSTSAQIDSLSAYSFDVKVFEKNVPYRLDFSFAYQTLQRQYQSEGVSHGLSSVIVGTGIDVIFTPEFTFTLALRTSVWTFGTDVLSGISDIGLAPFLFQGSAGFRITLPDAAPTGTS
ncbi:MAG TPA: hypothetical protein VMU36_13695 [Spirochaetia bacterium]|nr:hypothetical protein [Spirochaetia bacterium]